MKLNEVSREFALTDSEDNVIGFVCVSQSDGKKALSLTLEDTVEFSDQSEVVTFLEQIISVME